jgi:hypothetical protein
MTEPDLAPEAEPEPQPAPEAEPPKPPKAPRMRPMSIVRQSLTIYERHKWRLILSAIVVFAPLAVADAALDEIDSDHELLRLLLQLGTSALELVGAVFYAGLVTAAVLAWRSGQEHATPLQVARHLPWKTITALDLVLPLMIAVGIILLIVPGILIAVYYSLSPAFAEIDHTGFRESMRRSRQAVRGSFWQVLVVFLVLIVASQIIQQLLQDLVDHFVGGILIVILIQAIFAPFYGLATATMAFDRREAKPELAGRPSPAAAAH